MRRRGRYSTAPGSVENPLGKLLLIYLRPILPTETSLAAPQILSVVPERGGDHELTQIDPVWEV